MKISLLLAALLLAPHAVADEAADRAAIESIVASLNDRDEPSADLFTAEAKAAGETSRLSQLRRIILAPRRPWSEVSEPRLAVKSIHLVTPEIAMVEAQIGQYGMTSWSAPVVLLMKKESRWRIAMIRVYLSPYGQRIRTHGD